MKKKSLLLAISAMSIAAIGVGTVGTFAWYVSSANANIKNDFNAAGAISSASTSLDVVNTYHIKLTVGAVENVQLSHLGAGEYINGNSGATYIAGTLYKGVYVSDSSLVRAEALADNGLADFVKGYTVTATWVDEDGNPTTAPSDQYDVGYLGGKTFTVNLTAGGTTKLCKKNNKASGLNASGEEANATSATCKVHIAASTLGLTVDTYSLAYARLEPKELKDVEDGDDHGAGKDTITPAANVDGSGNVVFD